jgi:hypothetical protein
MITFHEDDINEGFELKDPGKYGAEVIEVTVKESSKGDEMLFLKFKDLESGTHLCTDNLTFGANAKGIAFKKIAMLGIQKNEGGVYELEPEELIGRQCGLNLVNQEYEGKKFLKPDFNADGFGYEKYAPS